MKKAVIAAIAAAVLAVPIVAQAGATPQPKGGPTPEVVRGTPGNDRIHTGNGSQAIYGLAGNDRIGAGRGIDYVYGGRGRDRVFTGSGGAPEKAFGGPGNDVINDFRSGESPGYLNGGRGHDKCVGDKHDTFISCEVIVWKK